MRSVAGRPRWIARELSQMNLALNHLRLWNGLDDGYIDGHLVIADRRIVEIAESALPNGRDCGGLTAIPGLIDAHVHMVLDPSISNPFKQTTDLEKLMPAMAARAADMVRAGITTARDLGGGNWHEFRLRDAIARGETPGPRLICAGQPITSTGGHCHFWGGEAADLRTALEVLDRQVEMGADLIKVMATGGNITPGSQPVEAQFDTETLAGIVGKARSLDLRVAAHCHGVDGIHNAAKAGVTTIEHCSWVGQEGWGLAYEDAIARCIAEQNAWVSPTINAGWQRFRTDKTRVDLVQSNYRRMRANGVRLIASTDAGIPNVFHHHLARALPVFQFFAELTPLETLIAATSSNAEAIGLGEITGQLTPEYAADLLLVEGDPLKDLAVLEGPVGVIANGRLVKEF
jgi:imidazolonepropionase-like amidohydrolase